jgi:hypothetical protein
MTGAEFWTYLQQKFDKAYSTYLDNTKANRLIAESMQRLVDKLWRKQSMEVDADEMAPFMLKGVTVTPAAGVVKISTLLPDYMHVMYMSAEYRIPFTVSSVTGTKLTAVKHKLRKGDIVRQGASTYTVKWVKGDEFDLGTAGLSAGSYSRVVVRDVAQYQSDRKGSPFHKASTDNPYFDFQSDGTSTPRSFKIHPATDLSNIVVDYIRTAPHVIDVTNNTTSLLDFYSRKFLYRLMDECVLNFGAQTRDPMIRQMAAQDIVDNP